MDAQIPKPGDLIAGKLLVERVIGTGGMGVVLAARHQELGERVAVKVLRLPAGEDERAVERLRREARAAAKLRGEHVVRVMDVGTMETGAPYLVMEYVAGQTVAQAREARGRVGVAEAVDWALQACEGLAEAHARGVVHRDIKPSNLLLSRRPDGSPLLKLLDFGIAKSLSVSPTTLTETGGFLGSPMYASPEQVRDARVVDHRTDIWSLGVVLYELLTGKLPFPSFTAAGALVSLVADPPVAPRAVAPDLPPRLERVLLRCLEKEPASRFADVAELARALAPFASDAARGATERVARILIQTSEPLTEPSASVEADASTIGGSQDESLNASRTARVPEMSASVGRTWRRWRATPAVLGMTGVVAVVGWLSRPSQHAGAPLEASSSPRALVAPSLSVAPSPSVVLAAERPPSAPVALPPASPSPSATAVTRVETTRPKPKAKVPLTRVQAPNASTGVLDGEEDFGPRK